MSRHDYGDDLDQWQLIKWRGQVASAMRGRRGQKFLNDLITALDAIPDKRLITSVLKDGSGDVCALGAVLEHRGVMVEPSEHEDAFDVDWTANRLDIANQLAREVTYENDECGWLETPEQRWTRLRRWAAKHLNQQQNT